MYVVVSGVFGYHHCCLNFKVMELLSSAAAVWWVWGELLPAVGFETACRCDVVFGLITGYWCTKLGVKNRWWTPRSFLGICPNFRWSQVKLWWLFRLSDEDVLYLFMLCYYVQIHILFWVPSFENVHVSWISYVEFEVWLCYSGGYYVEWVEVYV